MIGRRKKKKKHSSPHLRTLARVRFREYRVIPGVVLNWWMYDIRGGIFVIVGGYLYILYIAWVNELLLVE